MHMISNPTCPTPRMESAEVVEEGTVAPTLEVFRLALASLGVDLVFPPVSEEVWAVASVATWVEGLAALVEGLVVWA